MIGSIAPIYLSCAKYISLRYLCNIDVLLSLYAKCHQTLAFAFPPHYKKLDFCHVDTQLFCTRLSFIDTNHNINGKGLRMFCLSLFCDAVLLFRLSYVLLILFMFSSFLHIYSLIFVSFLAYSHQWFKGLLLKTILQQSNNIPILNELYLITRLFHITHIHVYTSHTQVWVHGNVNCKLLLVLIIFRRVALLHLLLKRDTPSTSPCQSAFLHSYVLYLQFLPAHNPVISILANFFYSS